MNRKAYRSYHGLTELDQSDFLSLLAAGEKDFSLCFIPSAGKLENLSLEGCLFDGSYVEVTAINCEFSGASFKGASVYGTFEGCQFNGSVFDEGTFGCRFRDCTLSNCSLICSRFKNGYIASSIIDKLDLRNALFDGTWAGGCSIKEPCMGIPSYTQGGATCDEVAWAKERFFRELLLGAV